VSVSAFPEVLAYGGQGAYNYAEVYWDEVCHDCSFWNSRNEYIVLNPGTIITGMQGYDCAHFVSCCVGEPGGGLPVPSDFPNGPYDIAGAQRLCDWLINSGNGIKKDAIYQLEMGNVIGYDWDSDGWIDHIALYISNGRIATHTKCYWNAYWDLGGIKTLIHVV
jgi:hypothetical protein